MSETVQRLTTRYFNNIVSFYDIKKLLDFYILFKNSSSVNGFYGYEHVKRMLCSLHFCFESFIHNWEDNEVFDKDEILKRNELTPHDTMIAAIFHELGYQQHSNSLSDDFNRSNIERSLYYFDRYNLFFSENIYLSDSIEWIIRATILHDKKYRDTFSLRDKIFIDSNLSMCLYEGFPLHSLLYYIELQKERYWYSLKEYLDMINRWKNECWFHLDIFNDIWEKEKEGIQEDCENFARYLVDEEGEMDFSRACKRLSNKGDYFYSVLRSNNFSVIGM